MGTPVRLAQDAGSVQNRPVDLTGLGSLCLCEPLPAGSCQCNWPGCQPATFLAERAFPVQHGLLDGSTANLQELGQFPLAHYLRPFRPNVFPCCSVRLGRRPGKRLSARAFAWPATERFLIEFRHHSLKASTIASRSFPVAVAALKTPCRQGPEFYSRPVQPAGQPLSGSAKVDRISGGSLKFSCQPAPSVTPEEGGCRTRCWSTLEQCEWMTRPGWVVSQTRVCDTGPQFTPFSLFWGGSQRYSAIRTSWRESDARVLRLRPHQPPQNLQAVGQRPRNPTPAWPFLTSIRTSASPGPPGPTAGGAGTLWTPGWLKATPWLWCPSTASGGAGWTPWATSTNCNGAA